MRKTQFTLKAQDCLVGMKDLADNSVDLVVTSPPYNLGVKYCAYNDNRSHDEYLAWSLQWSREVKRVLRDKGSFCVNLGASPSRPWMPHELSLAFKEQFVLQNTVHWIRSISIRTKSGEHISAGHFKPLRSPRFLNDCHEYVFHFTKSGDTPIDRLSIGVPYCDKSNVTRWSHTAGRDLRCRGNTWFIPYATKTGRRGKRSHPASFPVELAMNCIKMHGAIHDTVMLDPFMGIGNSALAAARAGVAEFVGFDIDPEYVKAAETALAKEMAGTRANVR